tara:strand:- start:1462 stop:2889 length:1428 start_codon:yes stop_codon:yes gene_type:complete
MPQADTVAIPKRFPLVVSPENRDNSVNKDARLVNAYQEKDAQTGETWIYKRPGLLQTGATKTGTGLGVYNWNGNIYSIFGTTLYKDGTSIGTVGGTGGVYQFSSSLGSTPRLQLMNGSFAYNWDNSTLAAISGANFPGNSYTDAAVKGIVYLAGSTFVLDVKAYLHGSDTPAGLNRPDLWTDVLNLLGAQIEPDRGVFLAKQLVYVLALKEWSTEVFYNAANPPGALVLSPVEGAKINYGCVSADSVQEVGGKLLWLAVTRDAGIQVVLLEALKSSVVSTKPLERILSSVSLTSIASFAVRLEGHQFYVLSLVTANLTFAYDTVEKEWSQWTDSSGNYFPIVSATFSPTYGRILQHTSNGKLYLLDSAYTNDDGAVITTDIYAPNFDGGTRRRKQLNSMEFIGDQTVGSTLQVRVNDSDYDNTKWSGFRNVDMSVKRPRLTNCGTFVRRAIHIRHAKDTRMRIQAVDLQIDLGTL